MGKNLFLQVGFGLLIFSLSMLGCSGAQPPPQDDPVSRQQVEKTFLLFRKQIQAGHGDSLVFFLSKESLNWLDDIRRASRTESIHHLEQRPFYEVLCILALRVERRGNPSFDDRPPGLLQQLVVESYPIKKAFLYTDLGVAKIFGDRAEIGLREAQNVPIFYFSKEREQWKFHLTKSLPLILQGAESMARQRKSTHLLQAIFILEEFGKKIVLPQDLNL